MAPETKRKAPPKVAAMKSRKRQRLESNATTSPSQKHTSKKSKRSGKPALLDDLNWKAVDMPDRLNDYEGFFGLEEVDDVDVIRNQDDGRVSYHLVAKGGKGQRKGNAQEGSDESELLTPESEEEWEGFSDEQDEVTEPISKDIEPSLKISAKAAMKDKKLDRNGGNSTSKKHTKPEGHKKASKTGDTGSDNGGPAFQALEEAESEDDVDTSAWAPLKLSPDTRSALSRLRFSRPTPIQSAAIPEILEGHDVIGKATTGSGKTLAFGIPILEYFLEVSESRLERRKKAAEKDAKQWRQPPIAMILSPTRELAHQITAHLEALRSKGDFEELRIATLTGGLSIQKQQRQLSTADIIIGTPGRLWEILSGGHGTLKALQKIKFLVVDEADRLLSDGHFKDVEEILSVLDREDDKPDDAEESEEDEEDEPIDEHEQRQTLVFSATFHKGLQKKLSGKWKPGGDLLDKTESMEYLLRKLRFREEKPKFIDVNPISQMASSLQEGLIECPGMEKDLYLYALLLAHPKQRILVFANSITAVRRLTPLMQNLEFAAQALHSHMIQKARLRSLERFTANANTGKNTQDYNILLATDVAARGLDIPNIDLIIHYHLPRTADAYVHRSGRTARSTASGKSILLCAPEEVAGVRRLIAKVHSKDEAQGFFIRTLDLNRRLVNRLKPRLVLAKEIADTGIAKEKKKSENDWMKEAAEDLGVDYDSEELDNGRGKSGRGGGRKKKEREARNISKEELAAMKAELKGLLSERVNGGASVKYLTSGGVDIEKELRGVKGIFLGQDLGLEW
ncbi:DEAD-domain-containing protein [Aulographum hederae CBS 113979]|uniref:ATP-dependent RNA helicase n=1 Tax=Aulographum hederae CBS 113979 TaxID=1176131 RepID=A0A6G1GVH5_9PEZI|nr:DEAD-domain-containing protein [Aulographum hederae CBS 113979]